MQVQIVPRLSDNYTYLVNSEQQPGLLVVDPTEPSVIDVIRETGQTVHAILNTHHHGDHIGGNRAILDAFPACSVYAFEGDAGRIPGQTHFLKDGDKVTLLGLHFAVWYIPGHTRGHIAYVGEGAAFVGDTVFGGGCGRVLEGTAEQLYGSISRLASLGDETLLYFAHEYTANNLRFALAVDPNNPDLQARVKDVAVARQAGLFTSPSPVGLERRTNPFFRVHEKPIVDRYAAELNGASEPSQVFARLRAEKDRYK